MKSTGIVRNIDDLGRVVIPKEVRRSLQINDGDPLEIFTRGNEIIFKKYSSLVNIRAGVMNILAAMYRTYKMTVVACDMEKVIAAKGNGSKEIVNRRITDSLMKIIEQRCLYAFLGNNDAFCYPVEGVERIAVACAPVLVSGDTAGAILYLSADEAPPSIATERQIALVQGFATYLGEQLGD